ncbi:helix-turn-helix domain-containing protein (plasmid) [Tolypothrix tenuis PCC 7101]|uniref:Helix-turn-helix domain-containing protein n=1 Tax=Tolypothrix tenuis PCC 7101 TaxID=231146 RepID=A0A1Z4NC51_9CYAN|nr:helix-turn-helix transcriptional regulator [Nostoc linckia FACHB-104]MBD2240570.1 helix-turn-helix transcriptional regulator [Aulosira sp. FACHB-113]BAZ03294.1 helix-turn-helix domain-containing protein [Tolypothrix tenuis PCC 7101]BAZ78645.1 helix-turn-helix domain-containing protein [Aulosira laxa NIES-50]
MGGSIYSVRYRAFLVRLRSARLEANLTQVEVAQKLNQPQSYVSRCESGERRVDVVELTDFAMIYKKPLEYFVDFCTPRNSDVNEAHK